RHRPGARFARRKRWPFIISQTNLAREIPMSIQTFFKSLTSTSTRRRPIRRRRPASRLCLEPLEDRCLLSFNLAVNYPVALAGATGDFNGDGRLDLVTTSFNSVSVLLNQGGGAF